MLERHLTLQYSGRSQSYQFFVRSQRVNVPCAVTISHAARAVTLYDECHAIEGSAGSSPKITQRRKKCDQSDLDRPIQVAAKHHGASVKHGELRRWPAGQRNIGE